MPHEILRAGIAPDLKTKRDILGNAVRLLQTLGMAQPKVGNRRRGRGREPSDPGDA